jgi:hypothetical protein
MFIKLPDPVRNFVSMYSQSRKTYPPSLDGQSSVHSHVGALITALHSCAAAPNHEHSAL